MTIRAAFAIVSLVLASLLPSASVRAAQPGAVVVSTQATSIGIEVNKGRLVRLEQPVTSVFLADPAIADVQVKSPTLVYVFGKKSGETSLFAVDAEDQILANFRINVTHNLSALDQALRRYIPDAAINVSTLGDAVVLSGVVRTAAQAEDARNLAARLAGGDVNVINRLGVNGPTQVNLRVRIAEVQRSVVKQFGVNWESIFRGGSFVFGLATGRDIISQTGREFTRSANADSAIAGINGGNWDLNAMIDALDSNGLISVLAEPNLTATSGQMASFLAGGEFPVPVPQDENTLTVEFKKFGVGLDFTPTILADGRITMRVRPEVSQLTNIGEVRVNSLVIPALTTRRAETTVELGSGQSFAIAGLIQNNQTHDVRKFPGLGDLPVLGALFRSDDFRRNETELVIVVTPYIVKPVSDPRIALPTDGLVASNDSERLAGGALYKPQAQGTAPGPVLSSGRRLIGQTGFILD